METPQREIATAAAAKLVLTNLQRALADTSSPKKEITNAVTPIFGIRWDSHVIRMATAGRLREILRSLRNSKMGNVNYQRFRPLWKSAQINEPNFPASWGDWRSIFGKFNMCDVMPLKDWVEVIGNLTKLQRMAPRKMALISPHVLTDSLQDGPLKLSALQLWKAVTLSFTDAPSASLLMLHGVSDSAEKLIRKISRSPICKRAATSDLKLPTYKHAPTKDFAMLGPSAKLTVLKKATLPQFKLDRYFRTASQGLSLTSIRRCFKSFDSAIRIHYIFCEMRSCPSFPFREKLIAEWIAIFKPGIHSAST